MSRVAPALVLSASLGLACGTSTEPADVGGDAGATAGFDGGGGETRSVEIGTGLDRFEPITEGQTLPLQVGPQGGGRLEGYHIFSAVKVRGYSPDSLLATFRILTEDRTPVAEQARSFRRLQPDGDAFVAFAVAPRIMDCCVVENQPVFLTVEVTDSNGLMGMDERQIIAGPICEDPENPGQSLCR